MKTSSTLYSLIFCSFAIVISCGITLFPEDALADVFIPSSEYIGYLDSHGVYTVGGNVKNQNDFAVIPLISVSTIDGEKTITKTVSHVPIPPMTDIPFKMKFPEIKGDNPVLQEPVLKYVITEKNSIPLEIIYDKTLITHDDGHVTGRIKNSGNQTIYNPKVLALAHSQDRVLDVVQNIDSIEKIEPDEIVDFSMYPDPAITDHVIYYSCFAPVDTTVVPVTTKKNGGNFDFRYDSGAWYYGAKFTDDGTTLSMNGYNSYPLETYANFEFPSISGQEKFEVTINDKPVKFIQSVDENKFWHVAFNIEPLSQGVLKITGFEKGLPDLPKIPSWIKTNADWWATNRIPDSEFMKGIDFLFKKVVISVPDKQITVESQWEVPSWFKTTAGWWSEDKISDDDFLNAVKNLVKRKIIIV